MGRGGGAHFLLFGPPPVRFVSPFSSLLLNLFVPLPFPSSLVPHVSALLVRPLSSSLFSPSLLFSPGPPSLPLPASPSLLTRPSVCPSSSLCLPLFSLFSPSLFLLPWPSVSSSSRFSLPSPPSLRLSLVLSLCLPLFSLFPRPSFLLPSSSLLSPPFSRQHRFPFSSLLPTLFVPLSSPSSPAPPSPSLSLSTPSHSQ